MNTAHLPFVCRPGTRKDIPAIMQIMDCAFAPAFGEAWTRPQVEGMLDLPGTWLTVATSDDYIVGFSLMHSVLEEPELLLISVNHSWHGRTTGTHLTLPQ